MISVIVFYLVGKDVNCYGHVCPDDTVYCKKIMKTSGDKKSYETSIYCVGNRRKFFALSILNNVANFPLVCQLFTWIRFKINIRPLFVFLSFLLLLLFYPFFRRHRRSKTFLNGKSKSERTQNEDDFDEWQSSC